MKTQTQSKKWKKMKFQQAKRKIQKKIYVEYVVKKEQAESSHKK